MHLKAKRGTPPLSSSYRINQWLGGILLAALAVLSGCSTVLDATNKGPVSEDLGRRTLGTVMDDEMLEGKAKVNIDAAHADLKQGNIRVIAFNGAVLLVGQVASQDLVELAEQTVRDLRHVQRVHNELQVAGTTTVLTRSSDRWLSLKVKSALAAAKDTAANRIKVVTEDGVVYLMGLLTHAEGDAAIAVARNVGGIKKIVKAFQYIN